MEAIALSYWTHLINLIVSSYFDDGLTTCILWNEQIEFHLTDSYSNQYVNIRLENLEESLAKDIFNFTLKAEELQQKNLSYDALILKLTVAIDIAQCESFIAFQEDIPKFSKAFRKASSYTKWRSQRSKFLFAYRKDIAVENGRDYFDDLLLIDQPRILVIETETWNSSIFQLKTNKFVGPLAENAGELQTINTFDAIKRTFKYPEKTLYPDKLKNLQGREIILAAFDYRPFIGIDNHKEPNYVDRALDNPKGSLYIDGTEARLVITFCELYNCSFQVDTTMKSVWGDVFDNGTGTGIAGMVVSHQADMAMDAFYIWDTQFIDMTMFLSRSGVTCLVPKPSRLTSWILPLKPFQLTLWLAVFACLCLETFALLVTYHAELLLISNDNDSNWSKSTRFGYATTFKIFLNQAPNIDAISLSVRIVLFSCFMIDIIITSIYGGGLSTILTIPTLAEAADSVERLHKFGIPWVASSTVWITGIMGNEQPLFKDLVKMFLVRTIDEMRELVKTENMGFTLERMPFGHFGNVDFLTPQTLDRLMLMHGDIYFTYNYGIVQRLWPFLPQFNELVMNWQSSGFNKFWEWKSSAEFLNGNMQVQIQTSSRRSIDVGPVKLDMSNFTGIITVWFLGCIVSFVIFCAEITYARLQSRKKERQLKRWKFVI